ncbi:hypothetical protein G5T42_07010 [Microbacterium sp. 4R-513]|uniref:hypothetical protein n=1 Tax=Microbacterium sp. 4R-513 TaxID=2567934 RepID=UPI0013E1D120|nr:hypothetical protein [Microbacterium sp. 4R-513]QIG38062.1 hypothetical protein G5T42_07010 [Microbacterium sp. 4R-513]
MAEEPDPLHVELRGLQRRAYGPDADIDSDPAALARLQELERAFAPRIVHPARAPDDLVEVGGSAAVAQSATEPPQPTPTPKPPVRRRAPFVGLAVAAAVAALAAFAPTVLAPLSAADRAAQPGSGEPSPAGAVSLSRGEVYRLYLEGKRNEVLNLPGVEGVAARMVREELRLYGRLYGRLVGAGPTLDGRLCMLVENEPSATAVCLRGPGPAPATVIFPAPQFDALSPTGSTLVEYTLGTDGQVVARPTTDSADGRVPVPVRTSIPAPGTQ